MDYQLKLAKIVSSREIDDKLPLNLFRVRILPEMAEIPASQNDMLPLFPNFFKDTNYAYQRDDLVWVVCNDDFQVGFILGYSQPPAGEGITSFIDEINNAEKDANFPVSAFEEISILRLSGSCFTYNNVVTGQSGNIYNNKSFFLFSADGKIWVKNPGMTMKVTPDGDLTITGKTKTEEFGDITIKGKASSEECSSKKIVADANLDLSSGGSFTKSTVGNSSEVVLGEVDTIIGKTKTETIGLGETKTIMVGGETETIVAGNYTLTVAAGTMNFTTGLGAMNMTAGGAITVTAPVFTLVAGAIKFPTGQAIPLMPSPGPFCALPFCLFTGMPHTASGYAGAGI